MWRGIADAYRRLMASHWGYNVFGRILPSVLFLWAFAVGLERLPDVAGALASPTPGALLGLANELLFRFVGLCQVFLFAVRKRVIGRMASPLGAAVALAASLFGNVGIFFNAFGWRPPPPSDGPLLAGLALGLGTVGTVLIALAFPWLGRHIGVFPEARGLVTGGPYRYLRHPIYTGYLLGAMGGTLLTVSVQSVLVYVAYYLLVAWRASFEERALEAVFGPAYRQYRRRAVGVAPDWLGRGRPR